MERDREASRRDFSHFRAKRAVEHTPRIYTAAGSVATLAKSSLAHSGATPATQRVVKTAEMCVQHHRIEQQTCIPHDSLSFSHLLTKYNRFFINTK